LELLERLRLFFRNLLNMEPSQFDAVPNSILIHLKISKEKFISMFISILLICIGLNTNSTMAVMGGLILFPMMMPYYGLGAGIASQNVQLVQASLKNILIQILLALSVSVVYFYISPIYIAKTSLQTFNHSSFAEIFVALIAGIAGFVSILKNNVKFVFVAVSVATGTMIPLVMTGYSLVYYELDLLNTSFYFYLVISFFLLFSALLVTFLLGIKNDAIEKMGKVLIGILGAVILVIGFWYTTHTLRKSIVMHNLDQYVSQVLTSKSMNVVSTDVDLNEKKIEIYYTGVKPESIQDMSLKKKHKLGGYTFNYNEI
jgi:uncharacterized membrane protein